MYSYNFMPMHVHIGIAYVAVFITEVIFFFIEQILDLAQ